MHLSTDLVVLGSEVQQMVLHGKKMENQMFFFILNKSNVK